MKLRDLYRGTRHDLKGCYTKRYLEYETMAHGWHEHDMADICGKLRAQNGVIHDAAIIAHSAGALTVAPALSSGKCELASTSKLLASYWRGNYVRKSLSG